MWRMRTLMIGALLAQLSNAPTRPSHAIVTVPPATVTGAAGSRVSLLVDVTPKAGVHVYAPGSDDYIAVAIKLNPLPTMTPGKIQYPKSTIMTFADEKVAVFASAFQLTQDITLEKSVKPGDTIVVAGKVTYQACDDRVCYPPESAPVSWTVNVK
jgi:Disulphide bond corrector protein DsbC